VDFELSDDEVALAEGVRRLCAGRFPLEDLRKAEGSPDVVDRSAWAALAEAGVFALRAGGEDGLGLGLAEASVVFEELGRALVPGPLVATHLAATYGLVPEAVAGGAVVGSLPSARQGGSDPLAPMLVEDLALCDALVAVHDDGVSIVETSELDAVPIARSIDPLTPLWRVERPPAGRRVGDAEVASRWRRDEDVLNASLLVGLAFAMLEMAVDYAKGREQFGRAIGSFQAVKHLCADMLVRAEVARAATHAAAVTADQPEVGDGERAAAGAALLAAEAGLANGRSCIQVHGGMGFTWEVPAHLYVTRARVVAARMRGGAELSELVAERY
jgi:alkylation response protein AidB-like acyl-CoA dehydrogenase